MSKTLYLAAPKVHALCRDALQQAGALPAEAELCAQSLLDASLNGIDSHGLTLLPIYVERLRSGQIRPGVAMCIQRQTAATAFCQGGGMGPAMAAAAVDLAVQKAKSTGIGAVNLAEANYVGALGFYARRAADQGLLALVGANATPRVAPQGGRQGLHGTNPIAYACPTKAGPPIVFDAATGHSAAAVNQAKEEGLPLPPGRALDAEGRPTQDPQAALAGVLLPVGGALGYGLGLLVDLLTGGLSGGPCGTDVPPVSTKDGPYGCSFFVLALDGAHFGDSLQERAAFLAASARALAPQADGPPVRVPGDRGRQCRSQRLEQGIPLSKKRWDELVQRLAACGISPAAADTD